MIRLHTESGAVYHIDQDNARMMRTGPHSRGIDYTNTPDDAWQYLQARDEFTIGERAHLWLGGGRYRVTTPLVRIDEVDG